MAVHRLAITLSFAGALLAAINQCAAQEFPSRAIRFVVPYGASGGPDVLARVIGRKLSENIGQAVVVDNRPGAGGIIGTDIVAKAAPDGYTVLVGDTGPLCINPTLYQKLPYDAIKDFAPVTLAVSTPVYLVGHAGLPFQNVRQLIDYAKANPGLPYGSTGVGSVHHLGMQLFASMAGVNMNHIPYKGVAQSIPAVISGDIAVVIAALPSVMPHVGTGKVRLLAVAGAKRTSNMPEVPTVAEGGLPGYDIKIDVGFLVPAGTPRAIVDKLNSEIIKVLNTPEVAQQLGKIGIDPVGSSPEQYAETIRADIQKFGKLIKDSGARAD